jgi:type I restriction enzyme S subunit
MKSEWRTVTVGELGRIVTGKTPKTAITENYGGYIPFLTPSDDMKVKMSTTTSKALTERGLSEVRNCLLPPRSICVSCIGSDLGKVIMTSQPTVTNQQINSIVPSSDYDADFVYYAMCILGRELNYISKTSTAVPIVNKSSFSSYQINIPPFSEQQEIGRILSALDDKITNNSAVNHHLTARSATDSSPVISRGKRESRIAARLSFSA